MKRDNGMIGALAFCATALLSACADAETLGGMETAAEDAVAETSQALTVQVGTMNFTQWRE